MITIQKYPKIIFLLFSLSMIFIFPASAYWINGTVNVSEAYIIKNWEGSEYNPYPKYPTYPYDCKYYINYTCKYANPENYTQSNNTGYYSLNNITSGNNITVFKLPTYYINQTNNITIASDIIRSVNLTLKPTGTITGCVTAFQSYGCFREAIKNSNRIMWFLGIIYMF